MRDPLTPGGWLSVLFLKSLANIERRTSVGSSSPEQSDSAIPVPNPQATGTILMRIGDERERQTAKIATGKIPWDCADNDVPSNAKLAVLVEEVGEVANALIENKHVGELYGELIQVAAVAAAWAEALIVANPEGDSS